MNLQNPHNFERSLSTIWCIFFFMREGVKEWVVHKLICYFVSGWGGGERKCMLGITVMYRYYISESTLMAWTTRWNKHTTNARNCRNSSSPNQTQMPYGILFSRCSSEYSGYSFIQHSIIQNLKNWSGHSSAILNQNFS